MIRYHCSNCDTKLESPASMAGRKDRCPVCGSPCDVPASRRRWPVAVGIGAGLLLLGIGVVVAIFVLMRPGQPDQRREELILDLGKDVTMKLVLIPAGKFLMGSPADEKGRNDNEGPQHEVTIGRPFFMGVYEVTLEQYGTLVGWGLTAKNRRRFPVRATSQGAEKFCEALSKKTGKTVRLPTEAEWEYACRAGATTRFSFGDDESDLHMYGNYANRSRTSFREYVLGGRFKPNAFGLYDMHGNVWEWCSDAYGENYYRNSPATDPKGPTKGRYQVLRGGSCRQPPDQCRAAHRGNYGPWQNTNYCGFRVVVEPDSGGE